MTTFQVFHVGGKPSPLGNGPLDIIANDGALVLTPVSTKRLGNGSGRATFEADLVKPNLLGKHVTGSIAVAQPRKGRYHDFRQLAFRAPVAGKTAQCAVETTDGLSFSLWYNGHALNIPLNAAKAAVGVRRGNDVLSDVYSANIAIGNVPMTVTVTATNAEYTVKTSNGRDTFYIAEAAPAKNPAMPDETTQDSPVIAKVHEEVNA